MPQIGHPQHNFRSPYGCVDGALPFIVYPPSIPNLTPVLSQHPATISQVRHIYAYTYIVKDT